jgi:hypothetical protein
MTTAFLHKLGHQHEDSGNVGLELEGRPETKVIIAANH